MRGGDRDARTHGRFMIHGALFGVGMVVISAFLAQATFSIWHQVATGEACLHSARSRCSACWPFLEQGRSRG